jgi:hypothetical protein
MLVPKGIIILFLSSRLLPPSQLVISSGDVPVSNRNRPGRFRGGALHHRSRRFRRWTFHHRTRRLRRRCLLRETRSPQSLRQVLRHRTSARSPGRNSLLRPGCRWRSGGTLLCLLFRVRNTPCIRIGILVDGFQCPFIVCERLDEFLIRIDERA